MSKFNTLILLPIFLLLLPLANAQGYNPVRERYELSLGYTNIIVIVIAIIILIVIIYGGFKFFAKRK
ncbi:MAG: hypothetical protein NTW30_01880 [Candidatus Aenigmarchaeota archaeon]|nr:hypothetical protein [Candidatus Aenigmarchaeota archaeon]